MRIVVRTLDGRALFETNSLVAWDKWRRENPGYIVVHDSKRGDVWHIVLELIQPSPVQGIK